MLQWKKSSYSANVQHCVEVAYSGWRKSSRSTNHSNCIEIAGAERAVAARDSKDPGGGVLVVSPAVWAAFLGGVRSGRFDR